jgi:sensor histidine kinase YesM
MSRNDFIFSQHIKPRLLRHAVFWIIFAGYLFLFRFYIRALPEMFEPATYIDKLGKLLIFLPVSFFYAYFALYYLLPNYILKARYLSLLGIVILLSLLLLSCSYLVSPLFDIRNVWDIPSSRDGVVKELDFAVNNVLVYPLTVSGFAIGIKMTKDWYLKQKENEELARLKIKTGVQLQKTLIHPKFLFRSLNSIYKDTLLGSEQSPGMLLKLSDLLSYMLYESNEERVPLEKEFSCIMDYLDLEKAGFGESLHMAVQHSADPSGKLIAPLILLPVLAFLFEQDRPNREGSLSVTIRTRLEENLFYFMITVYDDAEEINRLFEKKAELLPVEKRLSGLYPGRHGLEIMRRDDNLVLTLSLLLDEVRLPDRANNESTVAV